MNGWVIVLIVLVLGAVLYVAFSKSDLASSIRTRFKSGEKKAADSVETVDSDITAAAGAQANNVKTGRKGLFQIQQELAASEVDLNHVNEKIDDLNHAIALAHKNGDQATFNILVEKLNEETNTRASFEADHQKIMDELKGLEVDVDLERAKQATIESQGRVMVSQARRNDVSASINQTRAGLNDSGSDALMAKAQKALDRSTATSIASGRAAEGLTPGERADKQAQAYIDRAKKAPGVDAAALWDQMSADNQPVTK